MGFKWGEDSETIIKREVVKPPPPPLFEKKPKERSQGKSGKYLQEVMIPYLRRKIVDKNVEIRKLKAKIEDIKEKKREHVKARIRAIMFNKRNRFIQKYTVTNKRIISRAKDVFYDKVKAQRMVSTNYIDGVSAFPIIMQWCKEKNFDYNIFTIFLLMMHFEWFTYEDAKFYGYDTPTVRLRIRKLVAAGLVERIKGVHPSFVVNIQGKQLFDEFQIYYRKKIIKLFAALDKTEQRSGNTEVRVKMKQMPKAELVEKINLEDYDK